MGEVDDLARIQQAHHRRLLGLQLLADDLVGDAWDRTAGLDRAAAAEFSAAAAGIVEQVRLQTATLAVAYMGANDRAAGYDPAELLPELAAIRNGADPVAVYERSIVEARRRVANGVDVDAAMAAGRARATGTARTDVILENRAALAAGAEARPWVVGYRRVLTGKSCAFCATASTQRYHRADLLPIHQRCDCDVAEIFGTVDPGRVINHDLLDQLKAAGRADGRPDYWNGPYVVDETGAIRYRKVTKVDGPDGTQLERVTAGERVVPEVVEHGELGPVLTDARHATTTVEDLPERAVRRASATSDAAETLEERAPERAEPRRSRAKVSDPDVLAEARRRNLSPERIVELREEKAQRRFLEDRARREAAKSLTADDPDVVRLAAKYGIHPDDVLTARHRLADVRAVAREAAAQVQADAMRELDRFGTTRLRNPPRAGSRTSTGTAARRGEWDWLEQVSDREKARLSRQWYGGTLGPDQLAVNVSDALGRTVDVDEAMQLWLDATRRAEAAGALRRGKLPSLDAYSGQIDPNDLLRDVADSGFDVATLFGEDLEAAAHVAAAEQQLVADEALQYLGRAANAQHGPAPYRMSFQTWEEEVRDLEFAAREGHASPLELDRLAELVPQYLDEPDLDYEELYARIVSTARKAGEEVPDHARIPWA